MEEKKPNTQLSTVDEAPQFSLIFADDSEQMRKIAEHKAWLQRIRHERPNPAHHFKVAVYIRYFNQTNSTLSVFANLELRTAWSFW